MALATGDKSPSSEQSTSIHNTLMQYLVNVGKSSEGSEHFYNIKTSDNDDKDVGVKEFHVQESAKLVNNVSKVEQPLVVRIKAKMQEMKEKQLQESIGNGDTNSHICKVCFESSTASLLLPFRHFCCSTGLYLGWMRLLLLLGVS
ncbi:hypothetical protein MKX03_032576 [Papaver bracteatum]|nr:hypothetical protein MKX03_032576 [Papaver bracteatum]